jgi:hypothetical protein
VERVFGADEGLFARREALGDIRSMGVAQPIDLAARSAAPPPAAWGASAGGEDTAAGTLPTGAACELGGAVLGRVERRSEAQGMSAVAAVITLAFILIPV